MTLMNAPTFDAKREKRKALVIRISAAGVLVLLVAWWLLAGRPIDWPWHWDWYWGGRITVNHFMGDLESNDLAAAYGVWMHDKNWQQHTQRYDAYPFGRFEQDWSPQSPDNEYGAIQSHKIVAARMYGNVLLVAVLINGRKSDALDLAYDPKSKTLSFPPPGVELYLGP